MKKNKNPKKLLIKSLYPGGQEAMDKFVKEKMSYPESGLAEKIEGDVELEYRVGSHGKVLDAKVIKGINKDFDEEAMRIVKLFRFTAQTNKICVKTNGMCLEERGLTPIVVAPQRGEQTYATYLDTMDVAGSVVSPLASMRLRLVPPSVGGQTAHAPIGVSIGAVFFPCSPSESRGTMPSQCAREIWTRAAGKGKSSRDLTSTRRGEWMARWSVFLCC